MTPKLTCRKGHERSETNTFVDPRGCLGCRECRRRKDSRYKANNTDKVKTYHAAYRKNNPQYWCPTRMWERSIRRNFGLTAVAYDRLLKDQNSKCAICKTDKPGGRSDIHFHIDHDHQTGLIRGLLCASCNQMLGMVKDSAETLEAAISYLEGGAL